ncbi:hypothetical protein ACEQ8H_004169 [Pleosporales sp. CAS-2024a]
MTTPFEKALAAIDAAHALDPNTHTLPDNTTMPYELHYAQACTAYLAKRAPSAPDHVRLAVRAQHFQRWQVPRSTYPMTRAGYLAWRTFLQHGQAEQVTALCMRAGYDAAFAQRVGALMRKEGLRDGDEETQVLEDVACLVFLDDQFEAFEKAHDEEKVLRIVRKTWAKMTHKGHELALDMDMQGRRKELVDKALAQT